MSPFDLDGQTALVTGASSGLGRHFAALLARHGAAVVMAARRADLLHQAVAEIKASGGKAVALAMDVTSEASIRAGFEAALAEAGPVSILINNAGAAVTRRLADLTEEEWRGVIETNLVGAARVAKAAALQMVSRRVEGSIVNIASVLGLHPAVGVGAYAASKAGLISLTKSLAIELGPLGIRVNAIAPGYVNTDLSKAFFDAKAEQIRGSIPLRRFLEPSDLDGALLLLASAAGRAITGTTLVVDAGHSLVQMP